MQRTLVYILYNLLLPVVLLIGTPGFIIKGIRRGGLANNFRQRFGFFRPETIARFQKSPPIWIHAVSVGEVFLALKIVRALQKADPSRSIVLSTTTTTGFAVADENSSDSLTVIHNPVDLPFVTARVLRLVAPTHFVLIEAEIWPNLVAQLRRRGIPVILANARLSPRSERRYGKFRALIAPIFSQVSAVTVPFEIDRHRWSRIGIRPETIEVLGSVKFDDAPLAASPNELTNSLRDWLAETGMPPDSRILLAGSTHPGEEKLIAAAFAAVRKTEPDLALVIVPRHAERGAEVASDLSSDGWNSILKNGPNPVRSSTQQGIVPEKTIWIANATGELRSWFTLSEVVVIGKSLCGEGGQNPVEPILAGKPVIVGPEMQNFSDVVADLVAIDGIAKLTAADELAETLERLFQNPKLGHEMASRGKSAMARHEGAADRTATFILAQK